MDQAECYYNSLPAELNPKRDRMAKFLSEVGMLPTVPEGGYFMLADFSHIGTEQCLTFENSTQM
jgi:kynurenine--oxoglutarate transaminase/cysteine-S-conjugate beta-lyase/glutamine--phenylpyruvate transaminase